MTYPWQQKDKSLGGESRVREIPVNVLAIQYSGDGNFIFELIKL